ncbi:formate dehydrogenase family accessory protein FdhD [Methanocella conradii HZ254]|uniref:Sulfur carrier protein FdhD n=1 Tax=Methanocella conradii (strain DSM 24694 / JCM 17849 / CGMCC 1.5162 / HZ254) TaxID=1041930 RepID=H8I941_METCZ|nr:formate dehydrogenase accessory sulfurtransferase FdhD [Methanocella conradii]AFC99044.1 formate dehydrogenase family accessory protein FdhD [Methanocella conradii HZ254]
MDTVREYDSVKITRRGREPARDQVMVEATIDLLVNGTRLSSIVTTPEMHRELVVGYLITEGAISSMNDVQGIEQDGNKVDVKIKNFEHFNLWYELRSSGCIGINWEHRDEDLFLPIGQRFDIDIILDSLGYLYSDIHKKTRGAHTACLVDAGGEMRYRALDVGRHNAIDKVVGAAALAGEDVTKMFLLSSGRQPAGMVMKAARAGIPLVVSKAAPISSGIESARRANLTLACFADGEKVKAFSCPERIVS